MLKKIQLFFGNLMYVTHFEELTILLKTGQKMFQVNPSGPSIF